MGLMKGFEYFTIGIVVIVVLFYILASLVPVAQNTVSNADAGAFGLASGTNIMLGLIGFIFAATFLIKGIQEILGPDDRTRYDGGGYVGP